MLVELSLHSNTERLIRPMQVPTEEQQRQLLLSCFCAMTTNPAALRKGRKEGRKEEREGGREGGRKEEREGGSNYK